MHSLHTSTTTPAIAFARAGPAIRERLLQRIAQPSAPHNWLLLSLAWIGDDRVVEQFAVWRDHPPPWAGTLYVPLEDYACEAGWELLPGPQRHDLVTPVAYALVPRTGASESPVTVVRPTEELCGWCGQSLIALFTLDGTAPALAWLAVNAVVVVRTCPTCTCYGVIYTFTDAIQPGWHPANQRPAVLPADSGPLLPADRLVLAAQPRTPLYAAAWFLPIRFSQVGGHPTWIDDAWYPPCPGCTRRMPFVAQLAVEDIEAGEGIYSAFVCPACLIAATTYQQS
jgi:hypothetical protein